MIKLNQSQVTFNELAHTYTTPDGKQLSGVTTMLKKMLFADKYAGIDEQTLNRAAERGSLIHERIELFESLGAGDPSDTVLNEYLQLKKSVGADVLETEYLVSDDNNIASSIDLVLGDLSLADIKTTYHLDTDYVSWQLSVYAYFFEMQNPELKVNKLYAFWLPKQLLDGNTSRRGKVVEVMRHDNEEIKRLITAYLTDTSFYPDTVTIPEVSGTEIAQLSTLEVAIKKLKELQEQYDSLKAKILDSMLSNNITKCTIGGVSFTVKQPQTRTSIDSKKLQKEFPEAYEQCLKTSTIKQSLLISFN